MLPEKLRSLFRGVRPSVPETGQAKSSSASWLPRKSGEKETSISRQSRGLEQFFGAIRGQSGLTILDLGGASQANVSVITGLGHRLYSVDFLRSIEETFGFADVTDQSNPGRIEYFLRQNLDYVDDSFDGVLVWDVLEYMAPALLAATVERLQRVIRPGGYLLAFFHMDDKLVAVPFYNFRIQDLSTLQVTSRGERRPVQLFNNRSLEKLFSHFESVKFFLTRERLREILVRR